MTTIAEIRAARHARALRYAALVNAGSSRAAIARQEGICNERVAQLVGLIIPRGANDAVRTWTVREVIVLRGMWAAGASVSEIGRALDRTRNSIIGQAHRLGLAPRPSPIRRRA